MILIIKDKCIKCEQLKYITENFPPRLLEIKNVNKTGVFPIIPVLIDNNKYINNFEEIKEVLYKIKKENNLI